MIMIKHTWHFFMFLFRVVLFPIPLSMALLGIRMSTPILSNGVLFGIFDQYIRKKRLVFIDKGDKLEECSIENLQNYKYSLADHKDEKKFSVLHGDTSKSIVLDKIKKLGNSIEDIAQFPSIISKIDRENGTNLYEDIFLNGGYYPNFIRSDIEAWETLSELYFDYLMDSNEGVDDFLNYQRRQNLDQPGSMITFGQEDHFTADYLNFMTKGQSVHCQIKYQLLRYDQIAGAWGSELVSKKFGDWVYLLSVDTRFYLLSLINNLEVIYHTSNSLTLEFQIRNVFYNLMQCVDSELHSRVIAPFKKHADELDLSESKIATEAEEFHKFLLGNFPPTMAGTARFLDYVRKQKTTPNDPVVEAFLKFISTSEHLDISLLTKKRFIQKLFQIGRVRGSIMHPSKVNFEQFLPLLNYILDEDLPGEFFYSIGIDRTYSD